MRRTDVMRGLSIGSLYELARACPDEMIRAAARDELKRRNEAEVAKRAVRSK